MARHRLKRWAREIYRRWPERAALPPADLIDSIDQELAAGGRCARGEFKRHAADPGLGEPQVTGALTDDQRLALIRAAFPQARWACCGRVTDMCRYNVVVALRG